MSSASEPVAPAALPQDASPELDKDLDLVGTIIGHRLQQADIKRILAQLTTSDRDAFADKLADILRKTAALLEVARRVSDTLSLDLLLPRMVALVADLIGADRCTIFLHDRENEQLYSRIAMGDGVGEIRIPANAGIAGAVFAANQPEVIPDAYADVRFNREVDKKTGYTTRNILCAPIVDGRGGAIGVTQVLNKRTGHFTDDDVTLLQSINAQAASAFMNAQLHEELERQRNEESRLLEVTTAISRELQLQPLLQKIMETVTVILDADRSTLFMYDKKTKELWSNIAQGVGSKQIRFPSHLGIAGSVFTTGETVNIPDAYADPRFNRDVDKATGYKTNTILTMPVVNKQSERIGVTQVLNKRGGPFTKTDEKRLAAFGAQAAIAIENAQLFEEVVAVKNYNDAILQSMSNGVITVDADGNVRTANHAALRLFRAEAEPQRIVGRTLPDLFATTNPWLFEMLERVRLSGRTDIALDQDLQLRDSGSLAEHERRRDKASVNVNAVPMFGHKGESLGAMLVLEDITTEKRLRGTMSRYMPKELADQLMADGGEALGGQLTRATVLFTDIRSFTTISEVLGPQETVKMLNEYFSIMVDILMENGGILDKYIGDAIMAVFGVPLSRGNDADSAVRTAVGMLRAQHELNARRAIAGAQPLFMGVGINTDEVLSGNIGSPKRMDFTVIGDGVNLASRLEGANKPYGTSILVSELTKRSLSESFLLREIDRIRVKGKNEPVAIYEVMDHLPFDPALTIEIASQFECGLDSYRRRQFREARKIFDGLLLLYPKDVASKHYIERCDYFTAEPPEDDWDGVWTMKEK